MKTPEFLSQNDPFFTLSLDLFSWMDRAGFFLEINPAFTRFLGYETEALKGKSFASMSVLEDRPLVEEALARMDEERPVQELVVRVEDAWGHLHWLDIKAALHEQDLIHMVARDITQSRSLLLELDRSGERLNTVLESINDGFFILDTQWRFIYLNSEAERLLKRDRSEIKGVSIWDALPEVLGSVFEREYRRALRENVSIVFEAPSPRNRHWFEVHAHPYNGGLTVYFHDISKRKTAERQLRIIKQGIEASSNGVIITDACKDDLPIIYANPAFERLTGYQNEEVLGYNCRFLQGPDTDLETIREVREGIRDARQVQAVLRNYRKDGTPFWNELKVAPVHDEDGQLTHFIGEQHDITTQRDHEERLAYQATHDLLTGLPNRKLMEERLAKAASDTSSDSFIAVLYLDLDGFKPINDTLGHQTGDKVLQEVARRLSQEIDPKNNVARFGGDEFVVVMPACKDEAAVQALAEFILSAIARPYRVEGNDLSITVSIGIARSKGHLESPLTLVRRADMAMNQAKRKGYNSIHWYRQELMQKTRANVLLRHDLQKAIDTEQFELYYQPQINGLTNRVAGFEALIRWHHPERGTVSPVDFIGFAESTGQIIPISDWVLRTACRDARDLNSLGMGDLTMAVNISPLQFKRPNLVRNVLTALEASGLPPKLLELEITEDVLLEHASWVLEILDSLRREGVRLAIDDFGTGYSSLSYMKHMPVSKVKIDRAFVNGIISDPRDAAIVQGVISMAQAMGLEVVAEGVETHEQYVYLDSQSCTHYQGFHFAKPMPLPRLKEFLDEHYGAQKRTPN